MFFLSLTMFLLPAFGGEGGRKGPSKAGLMTMTEARDALEAAEKICGGSLIEGAKPGNIRAEVLSLEKPRPMTAYRDKTE